MIRFNRTKIILETRYDWGRIHTQHTDELHPDIGTPAM